MRGQARQIHNLGIIDKIRKWVALKILPEELRFAVTAAINSGQSICLDTLRTEDIESTKYDKAEDTLEQLVRANHHLDNGELSYRQFRFEKVPDAKKLVSATDGDPISITVNTEEKGELEFSGTIEMDRSNEKHGMTFGSCYITPSGESIENEPIPSRFINIQYRTDKQENIYSLNNSFECVWDGEKLEPTATSWSIKNDIS